MTACGCLECVAAYIPEVNGVMIVSREDTAKTPAGMSFEALAGLGGSGHQTPGVMGIAKSYILSPQFIAGDGGFKRVVWMSSNLKRSMSTQLAAVCQREGDPALIERIADGDTALTVPELLRWVRVHNHPVAAMEPMFEPM